MEDVTNKISMIILLTENTNNNHTIKATTSSTTRAFTREKMTSEMEKLFAQAKTGQKSEIVSMQHLL